MQPNEKALYVIEDSPIGSLGDQLALHIQIIEGQLCYLDTNRGHMLEGRMKETFENGFIFAQNRDAERRKEGLWTFREVTIEEFKHHLYQHVSNGQSIADSINSTEELWQWYRTNFPL